MTQMRLLRFEVREGIPFSSSDEATALPEELGIKGIKYIGDRVFEVDLIELAENVPHAVAN